MTTILGDKLVTTELRHRPSQASAPAAQRIDLSRFQRRRLRFHASRVIGLNYRGGEIVGVHADSQAHRDGVNVLTPNTLDANAAHALLLSCARLRTSTSPAARCLEQVGWWIMEVDGATETPIIVPLLLRAPDRMNVDTAPPLMPRCPADYVIGEFRCPCPGERIIGAPIHKAVDRNGAGLCGFYVRSRRVRCSHA